MLGFSYSISKRNHMKISQEAHSFQKNKGNRENGFGEIFNKNLNKLNKERHIFSYKKFTLCLVYFTFLS